MLVLGTETAEAYFLQLDVLGLMRPARANLSALGIIDRRVYWRIHADKIKEGILQQAWNSKSTVLPIPLGDGADASLLLIAELGFLPAG